MNVLAPPMLLAFLSTALLAGCTAISLERHTANQAMTTAEMRYQLVMDNLAKMAANLGNLPSQGVPTGGLAKVTDSAGFDARTALDGLKGFTGETLTGTASRNPELNWTIDPVHTEDQIRALQAAFAWVLTGAPPAQEEGNYLLLKDFQVYDDLLCLNALYSGWFRAGCKKDVPKHACYVGRYCKTYVWLAPGGMKGLSEFTLILADISTVDPSTLFGTATIALAEINPSKVEITQSIPFRLDDQDSTQVHLLSPIVCYGPSEKVNVSFDVGTGQPRVYQSGSHNASVEFRNLQIQRQMLQSQ